MINYIVIDGKRCERKDGTAMLENTGVMNSIHNVAVTNMLSESLNAAL